MPVSDLSSESLIVSRTVMTGHVMTVTFPEIEPLSAVDV